MSPPKSAALKRFAERALVEAYPSLLLDGRYEKVRLDGVFRAQAVLIAIGINWEGRRNVLGVELAHRESASSWKDFLAGLKARGLTGVELVVADDHAGLRRALVELLPEAAYGVEAHIAETFTFYRLFGDDDPVRPG